MVRFYLFQFTRFMPITKNMGIWKFFSEHCGIFSSKNSDFYNRFDFYLVDQRHVFEITGAMFSDKEAV